MAHPNPLHWKLRETIGPIIAQMTLRNLKFALAAYALLVDAKDEAPKAFYVHFGFKTLLDARMTLYLPLGR